MCQRLHDHMTNQISIHNQPGLRDLLARFRNSTERCLASVTYRTAGVGNLPDARRRLLTERQ